MRRTNSRSLVFKFDKTVLLRREVLVLQVLQVLVVSVGQVGVKLLEHTMQLAGRPRQDAHLLVQGNGGDDTRHFHHKNGEVHFEPRSVVN